MRLPGNSGNITNNEFDNDTGITTIAVSDATIDATAARIDSFDTINGGSTTMTLSWSDD